MNSLELWIDIDGYPGYQVSNKGRVRSSKTNNQKLDENGYHILKAHKRCEYLYVSLYQDGRIKNMLVHRLVAMAFIPNPNKHKYVNHIDEDKLNNNVKNLEWCTAIQNLKHSDIINKLLSAAHKSNEKKVLMYKDGAFVAEFDSITKAANAIGSRQQHVTSCLYGKCKTTKGYSFKFKK